jgi:rhomboid protease GluP
METRIGMQRRSFLCPNCGLLISLSEEVCPYCGLRAPAAKWRRLPVFKLLADPVLLVKSVIGVNIGMFVLALLLDPRTMGLVANPLQLLRPSDASLLVLGATGTIPIDSYHRFWTLVSAGYLHGGLLHIFFNMAAFKQLSHVAAREYGCSRTFIIYTLGGLCGFIVSYLAGISLTIGASAGVCGLVGAILYYGKSRGGSYGAALYKQVGMWVIILFVFGFVVPGINNWGHGGGLIGGAVGGYLLGYAERKRETALHKILGVVCLIATGLILAWAILTSLYYRFS